MSSVFEKSLGRSMHCGAFLRGRRFGGCGSIVYLSGETILGIDRQTLVLKSVNYRHARRAVEPNICSVTIIRLTCTQKYDQDADDICKISFIAST